MSKDIPIDIIEVGGKCYRLQHPGNRNWVRLKQELIDIKTNKFNIEKLLDYAFEHCVFPEGHNAEPTLDNLPLEDLETWEVILPNFFRGKVDSKWKPKKSGKES